MEYTKEEIILIGNAMYEASCQLSMARELLEQFKFNYFESSTLDRLIRVATSHPEIINVTITAISDYLFHTQVELDTFGHPESDRSSSTHSKTTYQLKYLPRPHFEGGISFPSRH